MLVHIKFTSFCGLGVHLLLIFEVVLQFTLLPQVVDGVKFCFKSTDHGVHVSVLPLVTIHELLCRKIGTLTTNNVNDS